MFCSRNDGPLALNFFSHKLLRKLSFLFHRWKWKFCSSIGDIFGFLLTVGALQWSFNCWPATNHIYILPVSTLWYIICSLFNHALVVLSILSLTIQISHHQWRIVILFLSDCWLPLKQVFASHPTPKMLKVPLHPHPPVIFSYQSMKLLQESTLQGCHKRDSFDHSCTLRRVYISIILLQ